MGFFQLQVAENLTQTGLKRNVFSPVTETPKCRFQASSIAGFRLNKSRELSCSPSVISGFLRGFSIRFPTAVFQSFHPFRFKTNKQEQVGFPRNSVLLTSLTLIPEPIPRAKEMWCNNYLRPKEHVSPLRDDRGVQGHGLKWEENEERVKLNMKIGSCCWKMGWVEFWNANHICLL